MPSASYVSVHCIKSLSKLVSKRFAMKLSAAQIVVCQASGYQSFGDIYASYESDDGLVQQQMSDLDAWQRRLGFALGSDLEELFRADELCTWFCRIHGVVRGEVEDVQVGLD